MPGDHDKADRPCIRYVADELLYIMYIIGTLLTGVASDAGTPVSPRGQENSWPGVGSVSYSESQVYRLVTGTPERIPARTFAALCDILECTPNDLFEPFVEMRAAATANAPKRSETLGIDPPGDSISHRVRLTRVEDDD